MTTHNKDKIIAAAIGCIEGPYNRSRAITITGNEIERLYAIAYEAGRQAELEYRPGYAGATIWIGENLVSSIVTKVKIDHEIEKGQAITNATQWCLDQLAIRARGDMK